MQCFEVCILGFYLRIKLLLYLQKQHCQNVVIVIKKFIRYGQSFDFKIFWGMFIKFIY
jgi:nitrogen regulatory protein PII